MMVLSRATRNMVRKHETNRSTVFAVGSSLGAAGLLDSGLAAEYWDGLLACVVAASDESPAATVSLWRVVGRDPMVTAKLVATPQHWERADWSQVY